MAVRRMLIAGRYRLLEPVGSGGMGRVWLARDEMLDRDVAVKEFVPPEWMTDEEQARLRTRTLREARSAARLNHPHVVRIYDVVHADNLPWIVMEYVPSRSLHQVIGEDGPFPPARAARIGLDVLEAITAAHRAGVLHRDVKPHNVLIGHDGRVVLTDFGLATFVDDGSVTGPGMVVGSPQYVSPERARDGASTVESDLWSFGATLYAAVEGRSPFARDSAMATLTALATDEIDPPVHAGPLTPVLAGLLRREPMERLTGAEVANRLRLIVAETGFLPPAPRTSGTTFGRAVVPGPRQSLDNLPGPGQVSPDGPPGVGGESLIRSASDGPRGPGKVPPSGPAPDGPSGLGEGSPVRSASGGLPGLGEGLSNGSASGGSPRRGKGSSSGPAAENRPGLGDGSLTRSASDGPPRPGEVSPNGSASGDQSGLSRPSSTRPASRDRSDLGDVSLDGSALRDRSDLGDVSLGGSALRDRSGLGDVSPDGSALDDRSGLGGVSLDGSAFEDRPGIGDVPPGRAGRGFDALPGAGGTGLGQTGLGAAAAHTRSTSGGQPAAASDGRTGPDRAGPGLAAGGRPGTDGRSQSEPAPADAAGNGLGAALAAALPGVVYPPGPAEERPESHPSGRAIPAPRGAPAGTVPPRPRRRLLVAGLVVAMLAGGGVATGVALHGDDDQSQARPGAVGQTPGVVPSSGSGGNSGGFSPVNCSSPAPSGLPRTPVPGANKLRDGWALYPGWSYFSDAGFHIAVPDGWTYQTIGTTICFRDPSNIRILSIDPDRSPQGDPVQACRKEVSRLRSAGELRSYTQLRIDRVPGLARAADWEYTYDGRDGERMHAMTRWRAANDGKAYAIGLMTLDLDWPGNFEKWGMIQSTFFTDS